jgi:hypothetical protein
MNQHRRVTTVALTAILAASSLAACQDQGGGKTQEKTPASAKEDGKPKAWRCYDFSVTNTEKERKITDLHFGLPAGATTGHVKTPTGWQGAEAGGTLTFKTPPDAPPAGGGPTVATTPAAPIDPGKTLDGFRFCLDKGEKITISISYDQGPNSQATVWQGVEADSGKAVRRTSTLRCHKIILQAPSDAEAFDAHFSKHGDTDPGFDDVALPSGWSGGASTDGVGLDAGKSPIGKGDKQTVEICVKSNPDQIDWKLTDAAHNDIPGAKGTVKLDTH